MDPQAKKLDGIHHVTCITADAPGNVRFYAGTLGLRLVKKSVNQDDPTIYHLFYADEEGGAGSDITFFEYPGAAPGVAGAGMIHRITFRVASEESLDFWTKRLGDAGVDTFRDDNRLRFNDPEGLGLELVVDTSGDEPLTAEHPKVPKEHALRGFDGVRAYVGDLARSKDLFENTLNFEVDGEMSWTIRGATRGSLFAYDDAPNARGIQGAGTVHHVAWATPMDEHEEWRRRVAQAGQQVTPVIDRFYFRSIYFREPSGVLFEIATQGPGFDVDEPLEDLGKNLALPPNYRHLREQLETQLTPLPDPHAEGSP